jgi:hypothetical protein
MQHGSHEIVKVAAGANGLEYLREGFAVSAAHDGSHDYRQYGRKLRTGYVLQCADGRRRRVWAMRYGNAASLYVVVDGRRAFLSIDAETLCEQVHA